MCLVVRFLVWLSFTGVYECRWLYPPDGCFGCSITTAVMNDAQGRANRSKVPCFGTWPNGAFAFMHCSECTMGAGLLFR